MDQHYFRVPFAESGDKTAVPDDEPIDGSVSYDSGYGPNYQLEPGVDPSALDIERDKMNEIFFDVTEAVKALQEFFAPEWITTADNDGVPFPYAAGALVLYTDGEVWQSLVDSNTATPGTDPAKWIVFLSTYATTAALAVVDAALTAETARAEAAEAALAVVDAALAVAITQAAPPGAVMGFAMAGAPSGWLACDGASVLRATYAALFAAIGTTYGSADGTHFNVPNFSGRFLRGSGGSAAAIGTAQADAYQDHAHPSGVATLVTTDTDVYGGTAQDIPGAAAAVFQRQNAGVVSQPKTGLELTGAGYRTAAETRPVNYAVNYCIKT